MVREFTLEGLTVYYQGERWIAVSDTGVEATWDRPFTKVTEGLDEESQAWGKAVHGQIMASLKAEEGIPYEGGAPPEAIDKMTAWGFKL